MMRGCKNCGHPIPRRMGVKSGFCCFECMKAFWGFH